MQPQVANGKVAFSINREINDWHSGGEKSSTSSWPGPPATECVVAKMREIRRRPGPQSGQQGFDAMGMMMVDMRNDGSWVTVVTDPLARRSLPTPTTTARWSVPHTSTPPPPATSDPPAPPSVDTRARLTKQGRRDTKPELALRRELHRRGLRYWVDKSPLPGLHRRADLVFPRRRVAVYVDGCFWHRCPEHATQPKNNARWWAKKLAANVARDRDTDTRLLEAGWRVLRFWEHEDPLTAADIVESVLRATP